MNDSQYKTWDTALKTAGLIGIFIGTAVGVGQYLYTADQQAKLETAKFAAEQNKPLLQKQAELYFQVSALSARISVEPNGRAKTKDIQDFEEMYYGPMVMVEDRFTAKDEKSPEGPQGKYASDRNVELRMIAYHRCLIEGTCPHGDGLETLSLQLADACRISLLQTAQEKADALKLGLSIRLNGKK